MIFFRPKALWLLLFVVAGLSLNPSASWAQQPGLPGFAPAPVPGAAAGDAGPGAPFVPSRPFSKVQFLVFDQFSFIQHPFFQLTGVSEFSTSHAAVGGSGDAFTVPPTDRDATFLEQGVHVLPPFGLEWGWGLPILLPRSASFGLDYSHVSEKDSDAISSSPTSVDPPPPRFQMDAYFYSAVGRVYLFDGAQGGINPFVGISMGLLNGNLLVKSFDPTISDQIVSFSATGVGATRLGIDVSRPSFGGRFEMILINAREVKFESNPFPDSELTTINFSGTILRISTYYRFL